MNPFKTVIIKDGFILHWKYRFGPLIPIAIVAGVGLQAFGKYQEGQAAATEGESQENMMRYSAALQERQTKQIEQQTALAQRRQAEEAARNKGKLAANIAYSGSVRGVGTNLLIESKQAAEDEFENLIIGYEGRERATAARSQAELDKLQGKIYREKGRAGRTAGIIGAGSTLLTGFSGMDFGGGGSPTGLGSPGTSGYHQY